MKPSWNAPPTQLLLSRMDVHIWRAGLDLTSKGVQDLNKNLSPDERINAEQFRFARDKSRFIAARGILRGILAYYLSVEPDAIQFCYEKSGKPRLHNSLCKTGIQFNLSHSEGLALYVFARGHEVGVDVEYMREMSEMQQIAAQFFSVRDRVFFDLSPRHEKMETFFKLWTRKEAFVKATGDGLSYPLDTFDVSVVPGMSLELLRRYGSAKEASRWSVKDVRPDKEYTGAFVVEGVGWEVQYWQWPD